MHWNDKDSDDDDDHNDDRVGNGNYNLMSTYIFFKFDIVLKRH